MVDGHDRDVRDGADRFLLELGDDAVELAADPGQLGCKTWTSSSAMHGLAAVRELLERAKPATLSEDGWIKKLSGLSDLEYERQRAEFAKAAGGRRSTIDGLRKKGQQGAANADEVTIREQLISIALERYDHFVDGADDAFGIIPVAGKRVVGVRVYSTAYRRWLVREYGQRNQVKLPSGVRVPRGAPAQAVAEALDAIAAHAANATPREPQLRVAWAADRSTVYLDLARAEDGAIIEIDAAGWRVVDWAPVPLVYAESALPLPIPIRPNDVGAVLAELEYLFGFKQDDGRVRAAARLSPPLPDAGRPLHPVVHHRRARQRQEHARPRDQADDRPDQSSAALPPGVARRPGDQRDEAGPPCLRQRVEHPAGHV